MKEIKAKDRKIKREPATGRFISNTRTIADIVTEKNDAINKINGLKELIEELGELSRRVSETLEEIHRLI